MYIIKKNSRNLYSINRKSFSSFEINDYLINFNKSIKKDKIENVKLKPIKESSSF